LLLFFKCCNQMLQSKETNWLEPFQFLPNPPPLPPHSSLHTSNENLFCQESSQIISLIYFKSAIYCQNCKRFLWIIFVYRIPTCPFLFQIHVCRPRSDVNTHQPRPVSVQHSNVMEWISARTHQMKEDVVRYLNTSLVSFVQVIN